MKRVAFIIIFFIFAGHAFSQKQGQARIDSLKAEIKNAIEDTNKVNLLNNISYATATINPDEGIAFAGTARLLAEKLDYKKGEAESYSNTALNLTSKADYSAALENHFKALAIHEENGNRREVAICYSNIGVVYDNQQNQEKALEYYRKAMSEFRILHFPQGLATTLGNMGLLYRARGESEEALKCFNEALAHAERKNDLAAMATCIGNIGNVYLDQKNYAKALESDLKALNLNDSIGDIVGAGIGMGNLGEVYFIIATDSNKTLLDSLFAGNKSKALQLSVSYLTRSLEIFKKIGFLNGIQEVNKYLINVYENTGDYKMALAAAREHMSVKDSVFNLEKSNRIAVLEANRIEQLKQKEIEIQKLQIQKAEKDQLLLIAAIISLFIITIILYSRFRLKKISNDKLKSTLDDLRSTQQQLVQQEKLASLGALAAGVAHEIQNPLNFVNNFSELSAELIDEYEAETDEIEKKEIFAGLKSNLIKINQHGKRADNIVKNMLMHSRSENNTREIADINQLCDEAISFSFHAMQARISGFNCTIQKDFAPNLPNLMVMRSDISRVVLNILNNAFYAMHQKKAGTGNAEYSPKILIRTNKTSDKLIITISDNGSGIPDKVMKKLFDPFFTTKPSNEGTGLGLSISYDIIKAHGGDIKVDNKNGTTFIIELPIT